MPQPARILVAPLNWGLGHATRCIPLIRALLDAGAEVTIGSDGQALEVLRREFPQLLCLELPAYNIHYRHGNMTRNLLGQMPKICRAVYREHRLIRKLCRHHAFDAILSDNRFGCYSRSVHSIFMTHQLHIRTPYPILDLLVRFFNRLFIRQFDACWVPDHPHPPRLAGRLSAALPGLHLRYIGNLSRMRALQVPIERDGLVVLSGPEPQRTRLEQKLLEQMQQTSQNWWLIRGLPHDPQDGNHRPNIKITGYLHGTALNQAIASSRFVVCRSGYSSLMDLAVLQKKVILIPTPGQTEQEYLAEQLAAQEQAVVQKQANLQLPAAIRALDQIKPLPEAVASDALLEAAVKALLHYLRLN